MNSNIEICDSDQRVKIWILPTIVFAQFCCTSLWFASNAVVFELADAFNLKISIVGHLTSAVQFGFIIGTLIFALLSIADRYSPSRVFFICGIIGPIFNLLLILEGNNSSTLILFRFLTGFFLAGIYPVGMKIAADYYQKGLGKSLGFLVGALVIGTAFPHLLNGYSGNFSWQYVILITSGMAVIGGLSILLLVPDGPNRIINKSPSFSTVFEVFRNTQFRAAAFGYFGHMWELYAFWTFVPFMLISFMKNNPTLDLDISILSFVIIALGGVACVVGGYISDILGAKKTAFIALAFSGLCCVFSPFFLSGDNHLLLIGFLIFWGLVVIADSALFSTLVANHAPASTKGAALTIVNSIGFAITILSIQLITTLINHMDQNYVYILLGAGPVFGLINMTKK